MRSSTGCIRRNGMTLIEVMVSIALAAVILLAFLSLLLPIVRANKITGLKIVATNAIRQQYEEAIACASDNRNVAQGTAKGLAYFLREMRGKKIAAGPGRVSHDDATGTVDYEFAVPEAGTRSVDQDDKYAANPLAVGVMTVFLREKTVPEEFLAWNTLTSSGATTPAGLSGFDMVGDCRYAADFSELIQSAGSGAALYSTSPLRRLPVRFRIDFFADAAKKTAGTPYLTVSQNYIVNDDSAASIDSAE